MHGLYLLWWVQEKHVPVGVVAALLAAGDLTIAALEIPTGWLADRCGHRISLIAGSLAQVAGMVFCWLGEGVPGLLSAILLVALGDAFRSGADQALLYRSCVALEREPDYQTIESRSRGTQLLALVVLILAGGAIVDTWGFAIGWLVEAALCTVGLAIACVMVEPPASVDETSSGAVSAIGVRLSLHGSAAELRMFLELIVPASLLGAAAGAAAFVAQTSGGTDPGRITVFVAIITLAEAAGSAAAAHLGASVKNQMILAALGAAAAVAGIALPAAFVPAVVALAFLTGVAHPLRAAAIQRVAADHVRARAASIASACDKAAATIALVWAGSLPRRR
jgi:Major Facilitator Superfamily